ncbi:MAG: GAF domain-containing protein [Fimbriimonadaceae bacterium]
MIASQALLESAARAKSEDELWAELAQTLVGLSGADACDLLTRQGEQLVLRASTHSPEYNNRVRISRSVGISGKVFTTSEPVFIASAAEKDSFYARYPGLDDSQTEGLAVIPIPPNLGVCLLRKDTEWPLDNSGQLELIKLIERMSLCAKVYLSGRNAGLDASRVGALSEVSTTIAQSPYIEEILQLLVNLTAQQFNYLVCTVRLLDEQHGELVLRATQAPAKAYARKRAIKLGESIAGRAIAEGKPIVIEDVQADADYIGHDLAVEQGMHSMICVPLTLHGRAVGVLSCYTSEIRAFSSEEIQALETLAKQAAVSIEHAKLQVRTTLMQEMHHRVKNSLQQVAALLRLQLRQAPYKSLDEALNDVLGRILAISAVHDLLSREDLDHVGIRSIAEMLAQHQLQALMKPTHKLNFEVKGDEIRLNMTQATQVALVLNELIQNAVEHGFERTFEGDIHVTVEDNEGEIGLWVSNNGDRLVESFDIVKQSNLGLQIVENLAKGLGGTFLLEQRLGWTVAEVKFSKAGMNLG